MKTIAGIVFFFILSVSLVFSSQALSIRQQPYGFTYDGMARENVQKPLMFVVCDTACVAPQQYLKPPPKDLSLSIKVSENLVNDRPAKESVAIKPAKENEKTPPEEKGPAVTVLFDFNSSLVKQTERAKLSTFIETNKEPLKQSNTTVTVEGYTCDLGDKLINNRLAKRRAANVASYLAKAGIHPSKVTGSGKCCYVTKDHNKRYLNRRVEVKINPKGE